MVIPLWEKVSRSVLSTEAVIAGQGRMPDYWPNLGVHTASILDDSLTYPSHDRPADPAVTLGYK